MTKSVVHSGGGGRAGPVGAGLTSAVRPVLRLAGWVASLPLLYKILLSSSLLAAGTVVFAVWVTSEHIAKSPGGGTHWGIASGLIVAGLGVVIAINFGAMKVAVRPIQTLAEAMERVGQGAYGTRAQKQRVSDSQIERAIDAFNRMAQSLEEQRQQLVRLSSQVLAAEEEERKRVARELHDDTSQALTTILVGLRGLEGARGRRVVVERVEALREVVTSAMQGVRRLDTMAIEVRDNGDIAVNTGAITKGGKNNPLRTVPYPPRAVSRSAAGERAQET
ncbi:MAG: histidine kinase [Chloroflexota bacterium]|nr:histidine kinase [Chloroflexota bacterium]